MGKFDGKQITGAVGPLIFKKSADGKTTIIQTKSDGIKQTKDTKKMATVMGNASTLSAAIRWNLSGLFDKNYQGTMINQLTTANQTILGHCFDKATETYAFQQDSFHNLAGFEFNTKSPLSACLWVEPSLSLDGNVLTVTVPEFNVPNQLKMPRNANAFTLCFQMGAYALHHSQIGDGKHFMIEIEPGQEIVPTQHITFDVLPGCLCVVGMAIHYYKVDNRYKIPKNTKNMNPAAIIDAIITPGEFVLPERRVENGRSYAMDWNSMGVLNLPKTVQE